MWRRAENFGLAARRPTACRRRRRLGLQLPKSLCSRSTSPLPIDSLAGARRKASSCIAGQHALPGPSDRHVGSPAVAHRQAGICHFGRPRRQRVQRLPAELTASVAVGDVRGLAPPGQQSYVLSVPMLAAWRLPTRWACHLRARCTCRVQLRLLRAHTPSTNSRLVGQSSSLTLSACPFMFPSVRACHRGPGSVEVSA
jgi:hypothetical protein